MEGNDFKDLHGITSRYAQTLNSLCSMQGSLAYASRRMVLIDAEMAITSLEAQCEQLIAQLDELLEAIAGYLPYMPKSTAKNGGDPDHSEMLKASNRPKDAFSKCEVKS